MITPVDGRAQGLVARESDRAPSGEEPESIIQARRDLFHRKDFDPCRREFNRQRDAIQALADLSHRRRVLIGYLELRLGGQGAIDEEPHGFVLRERDDRG